jgi:dipeptidyl aminopeptidase/acylaminoacyl peptidase
MDTMSSTDADTRRPTPELLVEVRTPAELAASPDGTRMAFSLHATVSERGPIAPSDLYVLEPRRPALQITHGEWSDRAPSWSPAGSQLAFVSDRIKRGHFVPYVMPATGGEPRPVAHLDGSAESVSWSNDARRLLVGVADAGAYSHEASAVAVTGARPDPDPIVYRRGTAYRRLFVVDLESGDALEVGPPDLCIWESDWDGDATVVATVSEDPMANGWYRARLVRLDLGARTAETLYEPEWPVEGLALSSDARHAAIVEGYSSDPGLLSGSVMVVNLETGEAMDPWPDLEDVGTVEWTGDDSLTYAGYDSVGTACGRLWLDGRREEAWSGDAYIGDEIGKPVVWEVGDALVTTHQAHGVPPELVRLDPVTGEWTRLTGFNDDIAAGMGFPDIRRMSWSAPDGLEVHGLLLTPRGADGPLPMIVGVHGGPTWAWSFYFSDSEPNAVLLADAGYAVLLPNPRGSVGRGHAFARGVMGNSGTADLEDIIAGVDLCIAEGVADPERLGISGLSYGGYMAGWAITQTDRFGASVALSVIGDYVTFHLTSEVARYDEMILGGEWDDPAGPYIERSPIFQMRGASTPTLVIQGQADRCTPVGQGEELYAALEAVGAEAELVVYPREGHVLVERAHVIDALHRTQDWFDRHLRPDP